MTNEKLTETILEISSKISSLEATLISINHNTEKMLEQILAHEQRITSLEQYHKPQTQTTTTVANNNNKEDDFKTELLKLLARAVTIGLVVIGSLSGASGIISKMFGV